MNPDILFENTDLLVLNKPAGLRVHPDGKGQKETVVDWILEKYPEIAGVGEPMTIDGNVIDRPGIVHRLDQETSGVLLIAKNQDTFFHLKQQFQQHTILKEYHAFVWGTFKEKEGVVEVPIGRSKSDPRRKSAGRGTRGEQRAALTRFEVAGETEENEARFAFVKLFPKTGRTHQLRVHMKYLQHPIVSDTLYTPSKPPALGFTRVALHARSIAFTLPTGDQQTVSAPYPSDFETALARVSFL